MIYAIIVFFRDSLGIKVPNVFFYNSTRMILAAITALVLSIFLGPFFIRQLNRLKIGQTIRTTEAPLLGELHSKKKNTPTMGGILILFSMIVSMFLWMDLTHVFTFILFMTTVVLGALGAYDDFLKIRSSSSRGLSARRKLLVQAIFSACVGFYMLSPAANHALQMGSWLRPPVIKEQQASSDAKKVSSTVSLTDYASRIYMPFFKDPIIQFSGIFIILAFLFIMFVITGSSNAVNLTDGLDGLAAGCLVMVATCFTLFAFVSNNVDLASYLNIVYIEGSGEIAIYLSAFAGACLGFLWYNGFPAQMFMGDTGSLALGGIIGVSAVLLKREMLLGIVGGIFVAETMSVILQVASYKLRNKKRILLCAPLHHHFEYKGWPETKVVLRFWIVGFLLAIVGIASLKFQ